MVRGKYRPKFFLNPYPYGNLVYHLISYTVKTEVSFQHLKVVCLSVNSTLRLSYRVLEMILLSVEIKSHSKVSKRQSKIHFQHSMR
jgi:hypothetical protein